MLKNSMIIFFLCVLNLNAKDLIHHEKADSCLLNNQTKQTNIDSAEIKKKNIYANRLEFLDKNTPIDLTYNDKVGVFIDSYLGVDKLLVEKMQAAKELYFPVFESILDKYNLPLELKYLAIVESSLNPKAKSPSGAVGLWQFMYLTGKQYGLSVTSYIDDRQDPYKSTESACIYFQKLYDMFGDWHLVLAAYNGGPGYIQRKINSVGSYNFWDLYPYLRKETRNYIPKFIAVNYVMSYSKTHNIYAQNIEFLNIKTDTLTLKKQVDFNVLSKITCIEQEILGYLNPSYKREVVPKDYKVILPLHAAVDFLNNEKANYEFIEAVANKEILIDEERIEYVVNQGDYLGKIAKEYNVRIYEIKHWNNLRSTDLDIGDKLIIYVKKQSPKKELNNIKNQYIVQKGDTLWEIAQRHKGVSVWKIKALNNMESDNLKPGTKIILPDI